MQLSQIGGCGGEVSVCCLFMRIVNIKESTLFVPTYNALYIARFDSSKSNLLFF